MKKVFILFVVLVIVIGMVACNDNSLATPDQKEPVTTTQSETKTAAQSATSAPADQTESSTAATGTPVQSETAQPTERQSIFDPYATDNVYDLSDSPERITVRC